MGSLVSLDRFDLKILDHLQRNGHCSNVELAAAVGLTPSPCLARMKRLQESGVIRGFDAVIDLARLGHFITAFTEITISEHRRDSFRLFEAAAERCPEIIECYNVTGGCDYILKIVAPSIADFSAILDNLLELDIGIIKFSNRIVLRQPFEARKMQLALTGG
ncbi:DNA-binding Lrp family transcriptional regulator [Bosea sp. OAE752]|jgi:DNA-binding Lrp family transcriptional regulator|uniref:Lrp/AsnC family transcriptional regulator n=1 Tax=Bosea spartocytisi TaxID=2773451 RepID=A0A927E495_9HYPH|nr:MULTISPECIES: Lrp/AsnC family transcriptional regulator [Bosea]MBD3844118.1 Lrp/AsnC family transcriptional regulator [Bosea spartocytisi]MCT4470774.1 Lrp/AsnC family transcriptional regulator [Bosea spartocytisi]